MFPQRPQAPGEIEILSDKRMMVMQLTLSIYTASLQGSDPIKLTIPTAIDAAIELHTEVYKRFEDQFAELEKGIRQTKEMRVKTYHAMKKEYFDESPNNPTLPHSVHLRVLMSLGLTEEDIPYDPQPAQENTTHGDNTGQA